MKQEVREDVEFLRAGQQETRGLLTKRDKVRHKEKRARKTCALTGKKNCNACFDASSRISYSTHPHPFLSANVFGNPEIPSQDFAAQFSSRNTHKEDYALPLSSIPLSSLPSRGPLVAPLSE